MTCSLDNADKCLEMLDHEYKFYLAFENSNCKDYITEKFFATALQRNILPIVMGPPRENYEKYAPQRSFIHVDDFHSPAELAAFLIKLDRDDDLYNSYFQWKGTGKVTAKHIEFFCKLCDRLHDNSIMSIPSWFEDVNLWWRGPGICDDTYEGTGIV